MDDKGLTIWEHLDVLRKHLFRILIMLVAFTVIGVVIIPQIFDSVILAPCSSDFLTYRLMAKLGRYIPFMPDFSDTSFSIEVININVTTQFMTYLSTSLAFGVSLLIPYALYEIWRFIKPALFPNEIRNVKTVFFIGGILFIIGCSVGYFLVFPLVFRFLVTFELSKQIENMVSLDSYMDNFFSMIIVMGIVFELPIVCWLLSKFGFIHRSFFSKYRRHAVVVTLIAAAFITPSGDPFSLFVVFLPLYMLWELSAFFVQKDKPELEEESAEE
ncbi:twin-arginine translocase subunit TatC [Viscerimonas tarda]